MTRDTAAKAWINVGLGGTFAESGAVRTTVADLDALQTELAATDKTRLVLYFHGGLVSETSGEALARRLATGYTDSPAIPLTVVWETAPAEILVANLHALHRTALLRKLLSWVVEKAAAYLGLAGGGARGDGAVVISHDEVESLLQSKEGVADLDARLERMQSSEGARGGLVAEADLGADQENLALLLQADLMTDPDLFDAIEGDEIGAASVRRQLGIDGGGARGLDIAVALFVLRVALATTNRVRRGTDHGLFPTAVEELLRAAYLADLGKWAWDGMKGAAENMWLDDGERPNSSTGHVGGYLLRRLEALQQTRPEFSIDLVGHSAGAVAICHLLRAIRAQGRAVRVRNVTFLAPACRLDLFADAVPRNAARGVRFRMFTMRDEQEKRDKLVPVLYPRSLLYLVSGALETEAGAALAGLERHLAKATATAGAELDDVRRWLGHDDRLVYAPSAPDAAVGLACAALSHGAFDDDKLTLASLVAIASA